MLSYAIIGIFFVLLIVLAIYATKDWHWANTVSLILIFIFGVGAAAATAKVLELRRKDMKDFYQSETNRERLEAQAYEAINGAPDSIAYGPESLRGLDEALKLEMAGQGRVWRNGQVEIKDENRVFKFQAARPGEGQLGTMQDILLYAFADQAVNEQAYPVAFIGTFRVTSETAEAVELQAEFISNQVEYGDPVSSWTLFEKMPADRFEAFVRAEGLDKSSDNFDITAYRNLLAEKYMPASNFGLAADSPEYQKILDRYAFDGLEIGQIENWLQANRPTSRFEPAPEEVLVEYKFNEKSNRKYQVDATGSLATDGMFTPNGQAVLTSLHVGGDGTVEFQKGEVVLVDRLNAEGYQRQDGETVPPFDQRENVTETGRIFRRTLRDYPYLLEDYARQSNRFDEEIRRVTDNNQAQDNAYNDAESQISERGELIKNLQADQEFLRRDEESIRSLLNVRQQELAEAQERIEKLRQQINDHYLKIRDARTAAAAE